MIEHGISYAWITDGEPGHIQILYASAGTESDPFGGDYIASCISEELRAKKHLGDAGKLKNTEADERHLFLWINCSRWDLYMAMPHLDLDSEIDVDPAIDTLWLSFPSNGSSGCESGEMLRWNRGTGWMSWSKPITLFECANKLSDPFEIAKVSTIHRRQMNKNSRRSGRGDYRYVRNQHPDIRNQLRTELDLFIPGTLVQKLTP